MFTTIQNEENALRLFFFRKKLLQGACADVFTWPILLGFHANGHNLCRSQNNRNVGTCWAKSLTGFKLYATSANKCQHFCGSLQTDATSHNIVGPNNVGCCWLTMLRRFAWALTVFDLSIKCNHMLIIWLPWLLKQRQWYHLNMS